MEIWQTVNQTLDTLDKEKGLKIANKTINSSGKKILEEIIKVQSPGKYKIMWKLKYIKQVIVESLLRDFGVDPTNPREVTAYLNFLRIYVTIYWSLLFGIGLGYFLYDLNQTLKSPSFTDSEYSRADIKRKMKNQKKNLKEIETINSVKRGGGVDSYSEAFLCPSFRFIHFLKISTSLKLKFSQKVAKQIKKKRVKKVKIIKGVPKIRLLLFIFLSSIKNRIGLDYLASLKEPISPIHSTFAIEKLYYIDLEQRLAQKGNYYNQSKIQAGNNCFILQPNQKLMTLGEFELRSGIVPDDKIPIPKIRNLSKIYHLKRNQVGTITKLRKKNQLLSTVYLEEEKAAPVTLKIPVSKLF